MTATPRVTRASASVGAEVAGLNLSEPTAEDLALLKSLLLEHHVVVVRGQSVDDEVLRSFASEFGPIAPPPPNYSSPSMTPDGLYDVDGAEFRASLWHTDLTYELNPMWLGILAAHVVPEVGGDTLWSNMCVALDRLSQPMADFVSGLRAVHSSFATDADPGSSVHPVVTARPGTGEPGLYVNPLWTRRVVGLTSQESQHLLDSLFEVATATPEITMRHRWLAGDVVIWDMRSTLHRAIDDYADQPRVLRRLSVLGEIPRSLDGRASEPLGTAS